MGRCDAADGLSPSRTTRSWMPPCWMPRCLTSTEPYSSASRAEIFCEMGLIDTTCPPASVWASLNAVPGKKTVNCVPYRTHAWPSNEEHPSWRNDYLQPRLDFIENYLK